MNHQDKISNQAFDSGIKENCTQEILFQDETQHLTDIKQKLDNALLEAEEDVLRLDREYRETKQYMVDYRSEMDGHEKLQNERLLAQTDRTGAYL